MTAVEGFVRDLVNSLGPLASAADTAEMRGDVLELSRICAERADAAFTLMQIPRSLIRKDMLKHVGQLPVRFVGGSVKDNASFAARNNRVIFGFGDGLGRAIREQFLAALAGELTAAAAVTLDGVRFDGDEAAYLTRRAYLLVTETPPPAEVTDDRLAAELQPLYEKLSSKDSIEGTDPFLVSKPKWLGGIANQLGLVLTVQALCARWPDAREAVTTFSQAGSGPPPGWHPDPLGRHRLRWWDGNVWTEWASDGGAAQSDPFG